MLHYARGTLWHFSTSNMGKIYFQSLKKMMITSFFEGRSAVIFLSWCYKSISISNDESSKINLLASTLCLRFCILKKVPFESSTLQFKDRQKIDFFLWYHICGHDTIFLFFLQSNKTELHFRAYKMRKNEKSWNNFCCIDIKNR